MDAGQLVNEIILLKKTATRDAIGGQTVSYVQVGDPVAAKVTPIRGVEYQALRQAQSEIQIRATIYYRDDIQSDWRVRWRGVDYELDEPPIDVDAKKEWTELMCKTAQNV